MIPIPYLTHVITDAEAEFDALTGAGKRLDVAARRAENAVARLIEAQPAMPADLAHRHAILARVAAEGLFPALADQLDAALGSAGGEPAGPPDRIVKKVRRVEIMPTHGHQRTRVIEKAVSLPRLAFLDDKTAI